MWLVWSLYACGVRRFYGLLRVCLSFYPFASVFALILSFCPFCSCCPLLVLLPSLFVLVSLWVFVWVIVSFSLTDYETKKKGRKGFAPCVLSSFVVYLLYSCIVIKEFCSSCFGFFQFARFVLPTNTARVRRLARSYFDFLRHYVDITNNRSAFLE